MPPAAAPELLLIGEFALRAGLTEYLVRRAAKMGFMPVQRAGKFHLYPAAEVESVRRKMIERGLIAGPSAPAAVA